jgi:TRAP transporter TAXI family solute receptor
MRQLLLTAALCLASLGAHAGDRIVTGSDRGTYIEIGRDLSRFIGKPAGLPLEVLPSKGSAENVRRLRSEPGVRLALVQSDVYRAYLDQANAGDAEAARLIKPLRVVMPLYDEEIYFVARADSPLRSIHELRDKRINVGPVGSGTALTATTLYRAMFGSPMLEQNTSFLSNEEALVKLATDKSIDVVVIVAGQPAKLFADMKSEARQYIKLLTLDRAAPETQALDGTYVPAQIRSTSYPNWLTQDVTSLSVKSMLVTYDYQSPEVRSSLTRFAKSMCSNFEKLKSEGHAKWQEVSLAPPQLPKGWTYYAPTQKVLSHCDSEAEPEHGAVASASKAPAASSCSQSREVLGLCRVASR